MLKNPFPIKIVMKKQEIIEKTAEYVRSSMVNGEPGHDWYHIERVWKTAKEIAKAERADMFIIEMAALLHDIADWKFHGIGAGEAKARRWLESLGIDKEDTDSAEKETIQTLEGKIVQDADRLDAIGAIGVARAFTFAGNKNIPIYVLGVKPRENMTFEDYQKTEKSSVNHFYEKLLLLKDRMNTKTGKKIAESRHKFLQQYLEQFFKEMEGNE